MVREGERMSIAVEVSLPDEEFILGEVLRTDGDADIVLETIVQAGAQSIPLFRLRNGPRERFEENVRNHSAVDAINVVKMCDEETLYALDWRSASDSFLETIQTVNANILEATRLSRTWTFELRFPSPEALSEFRQRCDDAGIRHALDEMRSPTESDVDPWCGLTLPQREALMRAVQEGYYAIPRRISTKELADELGISDQAVTERLRRAIVTLATNTCLQVQQEV